MGKRFTGGFVDLDPAISAIIEDGQNRQVARSMTKAQKRQAARNRMTFDIRPETEQRLTDLAAELSIPLSQLAEWLILRGLDHTTEDELSEARIPCRSMRYEFVLFTTVGDTKGRPKG